MSHSLNSLQGDYRVKGVGFRGDTGSLDKLIFRGVIGTRFKRRTITCDKLGFRRNPRPRFLVAVKELR